jgi:hypothetical protein
MDATAKFVAVVAVAAFATERILAAVSYVMNSLRLRRINPERAMRLRKRQQRRFILLAIAAAIALLVVARAHLRILGVLQIDKPDPYVDFWLTWLIVFAGADRVRSILGKGGADESGPAIHASIDGGKLQELHRVR